MPGETDQTIEETIDFIINTMKYYPDPFRKKLNFISSVNYAQSLPGTPLYEYAREHGFIGKGLDDEEKYLIDISDKDAYDNDHFINFTKQPLLKVLSWRYLIYWKIWREHAKINLKINLSKGKILFGLIAIFINRFLKTNIKSSLEKEFNNFKSKSNYKSPYYNLRDSFITTDALRLLIPWNNYSYPFFAISIAYKESKNIKWFFKMIFEHIIWSFKKFDESKLPSETLRKIVNIKDKDETLELRKGR